jgi:pimeloyl-ACP methyl ester carboxylesterase
LRGRPDKLARDQNQECVILIHGLWMNGGVLLLQQRWLRAAGYAVRRFSYPSWEAGLDENVGALARFVAETPGERIHLVAHSLGGLVVLSMLADAPDTRLRRAVLMATPCAGSHCGAVMLSVPALAPVIGRTYRDWISRPQPQPVSAVDIGIIAGTLRFGMGRLIPGLTGPNDGLIRVDETRLPGAKDHIVLPVSHSGMLVSADCARQAAHFLREGVFLRD